VWARTDGQVAALVEQRRVDAAGFRADELARMGQVMANFQIYKAIEIAMILLGTGLIFFVCKRSGLTAIGLGCMLQGSAMLMFDLFAATRLRRGDCAGVGSSADSCAAFGFCAITSSWPIAG
jgi:hypothetical protein